MAVVKINSGTFTRCSSEDGDSGGVGAGVLGMEVGDSEMRMS